MLVELRDVETFLVLAEELHFGRAAARLRVTQGRVSQTIKALEREVGAALFERTSRAVRITPLGERFLAGVRPAHERLLQTLAACRVEARGIGSQLRVGYLPSIGITFVTRLVSAFEARYPQCVVINLVARGIGPAALPSGPEVLLTWSPDGDGHLLRKAGVSVGPVLRAEQRAVVVPAGHPLTRHESVSLDDIADYELLKFGGSGLSDVTEAWVPVVAPSGRPMRHTVDNVFQLTAKTEVSLEDSLALVARGRCVHLSIASALERVPFPGLVVVPVRDIAPMVAVPIWQTAAENATIRAFVAVAVSNRELSPLAPLIDT
ncbi:LysR family transcriptional regulator [Streptomyces gilvus]|uniref:LysR family transcriptional regulator n=1 Tax=Streptomyces gilvus TaxID=2920937 RepID=UPI001F0E0BAD|nr:LysR family transcriptional regulator [Streptomyces sp. CME 23]MCH5676842.1 LysR family transcriptional regulator [Streptomyces sp. CME 23]